MEKLISIIIPCYNVENCIERCLESLVNQSIGIENLEIILVDDASTDGTWSKIEAFEKSYPESVMAIHCDENGRQGTARNIGMQYASAEYVSYIDSDDWIEEDMLEILYQPMKTHSYDFTACGFWRDKADGKPLAPRTEGVGDKHFVIDNDSKRGTFVMCMSAGLTAWGKLYRRSFLLDNDIFFLEKCAYEDRFFILLVYLYAKDILVIDNRCYHYFVNMNSTILKSGASYHFDIIDVDTVTWDECENRGFLNRLREELECYFLLIGYLSALKLVCFRYETPPYDFFNRLKEETLKRIPDYRKNPYIKEYATEFNYGVLETLILPIDEKNFMSLCETIKKRYQ